MSPTSDDVDIFDSHCFATTPSSSNDNSDAEEPASPTSQLLMEYEEHLRNTLEKDSESFSLHTFEALLSRSMENLGERANAMPPFPIRPAPFTNKAEIIFAIQYNLEVHL